MKIYAAHVAHMKKEIDKYVESRGGWVTNIEANAEALWHLLPDEEKLQTFPPFNNSGLYTLAELKRQLKRSVEYINKSLKIISDIDNMNAVGCRVNKKGDR